MATNQTKHLTRDALTAKLRSDNLHNERPHLADYIERGLAVYESNGESVVLQGSYAAGNATDEEPSPVVTRSVPGATPAPVVPIEPARAPDASAELVAEVSRRAAKNTISPQAPDASASLAELAAYRATRGPEVA